MDSQELVTVYTVGNPVQAEIIKNALQANGIRCFLDGINQAAEAGLMALEIKVQVAPADADKARKLVESHDASKQPKPRTWTEKK
jgi:Putative prokaryotic signal transducing protein